MVPGRSKTYHKVTISLTAEQHAWIRRVAAQAQLEGVSITAADVIRLALTRLQDQLAERDLRTELIAHVLKEVEHYPGRANRGLPNLLGHLAGHSHGPWQASNPGRRFVSCCHASSALLCRSLLTAAGPLLPDGRPSRQSWSDALP
jgi:hypothetical protein